MPPRSESRGKTYGLQLLAQPRAGSDEEQVPRSRFLLRFRVLRDPGRHGAEGLAPLR